MDIDDLPLEMQKQINDYRKNQEAKRQFTRTKVKIFASDGYADVENMVNDWLEKNKDVKIVDVKFQSYGYGYNVDEWNNVDRNFATAVMIIYLY